MENRARWYSRYHMDVVGVLLIVVGAWTAIMFLPAISISILFLALFAGPGVFLCYRLVSAHLFSLSDLFLAVSIFFGITAWPYTFYTTSIGYSIYRYGFVGYGISSQNSYSLLIDSLKIVVPVVFGGTLVLAWLLRKRLSYNREKWARVRSMWDAFKMIAPFTLLVLTPFVIGFLHDYNRRFDANPSQLIQLKVVHEWTSEFVDDYGVSEYEHWLRAETLDGKLSYSFRVNFNCGTGLGDMFEIKVHRGALGYEWLEVDL